MKHLIIATTLVLSIVSIGPAHAEKWECWQAHDSYKTVLVRLTNDTQSGRRVGNVQVFPGTVDVADSKQTAAYYVDGINRRWDWGWSDEPSSSRYSIIIEPTGNAYYVDFSIKSPAQPQEFFQCEQR